MSKRNQVGLAEVNENIHEKVFYLPHRPVIRDYTETTKVGIVYDASAKPNKNSVTLNDRLETVSSLQKFIWHILI